MTSLQLSSYVPTLAIRPAEMRGLEFLPRSSKRAMTPTFLIAPWTSARSLASAIVRAEAAYPSMPYLADIERNYYTSSPERPAYQEYLELRDPSDGYQAWRRFAEDHEMLNPAVQIVDTDRDGINTQIDTFRALGRHWFLRITPSIRVDSLAEIVGDLNDRGFADFHVTLDYGHVNDAIAIESWVSGLLRGGLAHLRPSVPIVVTCTTFPTEFFEDQDGTPITYRFSNHRLLEQLRRSHNQRSFIYGDWGSTKPRVPPSILNKPVPRIDYPVLDQWFIARERADVDPFEQNAINIRRSAAWNGRLGI